MFGFVDPNINRRGGAPAPSGVDSDGLEGSKLAWRTETEFSAKGLTGSIGDPPVQQIFGVR